MKLHSSFVCERTQSNNNFQFAHGLIETYNNADANQLEKMSQIRVL